MSFGQQLQRLRRGNNMTQEEFAQQLNVSRQAVSKWESSRGYPEIEKIIYICNYYGITMDELFAEEVTHASPAPDADAPPPAAKQGLAHQPLKQAIGNFFANLSPKNQQLFTAGLALALTAFLILCSIMVAKGGSDQMILKLVWAGLLVVFTIGEALTVGLTSVWFAAGSLVALICALLGANLWIQLTAFIAASALSLAAFRPLAMKYINEKVEPTNVDRIIGTEAIVTEEIHNLRATGTVRIGGLTWSARSENDDLIPSGTLVRVLRIEGVKVYVETVKEEAVCL